MRDRGGKGCREREREEYAGDKGEEEKKARKALKIKKTTQSSY